MIGLLPIRIKHLYVWIVVMKEEKNEYETRTRGYELRGYVGK